MNGVYNNLICEGNVGMNGHIVHTDIYREQIDSLSVKCTAKSNGGNTLDMTVKTLARHCGYRKISLWRNNILNLARLKALMFASSSNCLNDA